MFELARFVPAFAILLAARSLCAAELAVTFTGLESERGVLMIGLYPTPDGFKKALDLYSQSDGFLRDRGRLIGAVIRLDTRVRTMTFSGLLPGRYGIIAFHDQDVDGKIDKILGVPTERYGFSNNARGILGTPPDFDDAAVLLDEEYKEITIEMSW